MNSVAFVERHHLDSNFQVILPHLLLEYHVNTHHAVYWRHIQGGPLSKLAFDLYLPPE